MSTLKLRPPFRVEHVGSLVRPKELYDQRVLLEEGKCGREDLVAAEDAAVAHVVKLQRDLGLGTITDGEMRREVFFEGVFDKLEGMTYLPHRPMTEFKSYIPHVKILSAMGFTESPSWYCSGKIKRTVPFYVDHFKALKAVVPPEVTSLEPWSFWKISPTVFITQDVSRIKVNMCPPTWIHQRHGSDLTYDPAVYKSDDEYFDDLGIAYRAEIKELYELGCRNIQLDDPTFCYFCNDDMITGMEAAGVDHEALLDTYIRAINICTVDRPQDLHIGLHMCRGNFRGGIHFSEGGYHRIAVKLFNSVDVDTFYLEYDNERSGDFSPLKHLPPHRVAVLGIVTTKSPKAGSKMLKPSRLEFMKLRMWWQLEILLDRKRQHLISLGFLWIFSSLADSLPRLGFALAHSVVSPPSGREILSQKRMRRRSCNYCLKLQKKFGSRLPNSLSLRLRLRSAMMSKSLGQGGREQVITSPLIPVGAPTAPGDLFSEIISQIFGVPRNISISSTDVDGTFSTVMPLNASDQVVLTLSDSTGFGSGGSTQILKVGPSTGESCNLTAPALPFTFGPDTAPTQCQKYTFIDFAGATPPVTVIGVIPGGDSFVLNVPPTATQFDWTANVYNDTTIIFMMIDAQGRPGGSVRYTVALSGDSSCINDQSPSSTIPPSSGPTSSSSSPSPSSSSAPSTPSSNVGAIAGSVLGALIFLAVLITLGLFFLRQRQEKKNARMAGGNEFRRSRPLNPSELDLTYDPQRNLNSSPFMSASGTPTTSTFNQVPPAHYVPHSRYLGSGPETENPFNSPAQSSSHNTHNTDVDPFMERESDATSAGQRKSGMAGLTSYTPSRYIVHTDAEDDIAPNEDGVIELPPQYSASRGPPRSNTYNTRPS
ncbi:Methionine vitamin-b12 [Mycena venus]|uniref:Methionine vitamin-b12 n=1 Tax=Mycena venus TaxID=2733690 RepID=A0A8H7CRS6_9AGAR|nr:Methionine vitamin-b12 [Mycena venus]